MKSAYALLFLISSYCVADIEDAFEWAIENDWTNQKRDWLGEDYSNQRSQERDHKIVPRKNLQQDSESTKGFFNFTLKSPMCVLEILAVTIGCYLFISKR